MGNNRAPLDVSDVGGNFDEKSLSIAAGVCVLAMGAAAQMVDLITVKLPYAATVGRVTLPAGEYSIRNLNDDGSSPVIEIRSTAGPSVTATVTQVSAPDRKLADRTEVILRHEGNKYQIDKIWMQGRDYGYDLHPAIRRER